MTYHTWTTGDEATMLRQWGRASAKEIARQIGCSVPTVRAHAVASGLHEVKPRPVKQGLIGKIAYEAACAGEGWLSIARRLNRASPNVQAAAKAHARKHGLPPVPPKVRSCCTPRLAALLGTLPDTVIAERANVDRSTVVYWRRVRGIPAFVGTAWAECAAAK